MPLDQGRPHHCQVMLRFWAGAAPVSPTTLSHPVGTASQSSELYSHPRALLLKTEYHHIPHCAHKLADQESPSAHESGALLLCSQCTGFALQSFLRVLHHNIQKRCSKPVSPSTAAGLPSRRMKEIEDLRSQNNTIAASLSLQAAGLRCPERVLQDSPSHAALPARLSCWACAQQHPCAAFKQHLQQIYFLCAVGCRGNAQAGRLASGPWR